MIYAKHKHWLLETSYIYCNRHQLDFETFIEDVFISNVFNNGVNDEFECIYQELQNIATIPNYQLKYITEVEYYKCVVNFKD